MSKPAKSILGILILIVAAKAIYYYGFMPLEVASPGPFVANYTAHPVGIYTHVFAAVTALLLGGSQFSSRLRRDYRQLHRWMGRIYLGVGVLVGGISGLYMSLFAFGGLAVKLGFAGLALAWLFTGWKAYQSIRAGAVTEHCAWMVRNFSLTLAAVSLRVWLPLSMMAGIDFVLAYSFIAWLCWVPNLMIAEMFNRSAGPARGFVNSPLAK